jgi:hypothetical protein
LLSDRARFGCEVDCVGASGDDDRAVCACDPELTETIRTYAVDGLDSTASTTTGVDGEGVTYLGAREVGTQLDFRDGASRTCADPATEPLYEFLERSLGAIETGDKCAVLYSVARYVGTTLLLVAV